MNTLFILLSLFLTPKESAVTVFNNGDTVCIFAKEGNHTLMAQEKTDWYLLPDTTTAFLTNADEFDVQNGDGVAVKHGGQWMYRYIFELDTVSSYTMTVEPECSSTRVILNKEVPPFRYTSASGASRRIDRFLTFRYHNLVWKEGGWTDTERSTTFPDNGTTYLLPAIYEPTEITMTADSAWREELGTVQTESYGALSQALAFAIHPTHTTATRWEGQEQVNEVEPPTSDDFLSGSGPLDILFQANPTPTTEWYNWEIYKGTTLLFTRRDPDLRYYFEEGGNYSVKVTATNSYCTCEGTDSTCYAEFDVHIAESYLNVPNVFTPNGDGANDEFRVDYKSIVDYHIWVYNRWNKLVYESTNPMEGWDGNINGRPASAGAYFYVIRAKGVDAAKGADYMSKISYDKKRKSAKPEEINSLLGIYQLAGDINLLR